MFMDLMNCPYCSMIGTTLGTFLVGLGMFSFWNWYWPRKRCYTNFAYESLAGKVVLITGASSGLGEEFSCLFYHHGCRLIIASRRLNELERVKQQLLKEQESLNSLRNRNLQLYEPKVVQIDLANLESVSEIFRSKILPLYGRVDILVNNAGISSRGIAIESDLVEVDLKMMTVNYLSQVSLTKESLRSMTKSGYGRIISIGSVQGRFAVPNRSSYAASKHAFQAFNDSLRSELSVTYPSNQISVHVISPGYIRTNLSVNALAGDGTKYGMVDQTTAAGYSPEYVARMAMETMLNQEPEMILSEMIPKLLIVIRAVAPTLYFRIMKLYAKNKR